MRILLILLVLILSSCTHTLKIRSSPFLSPIVDEKSLGGHFGVVASSPTTVTVVNDITSNPPIRSEVKINEDYDVGDILLLTHVGFDLSLSLIGSVEVYASNSISGLKWQFLNPGGKSEVFVGALRVGLGSNSTSTSSSSGGVESNAKSNISAQEKGLSVGYIVRPTFIPYLSYVENTFEAKTSVTNSSGSFPGYEDFGKHTILSLGLANSTPGFDYGIEYNMINIKWDRSLASYQNTLGLKAGVRW